MWYGDADIAQPFTLGAFAIIFNKKQHVLLCHRHDMDLWNLPGGGVESGELPTDAAIRETMEETGLHIRLKKLVGVYSKPDADDLVFAFTGEVIGGNLTTTDEADNHAYFAIDAIPINTSPRQVERIRDALHVEGAPYFRQQNAPSTIEWRNILTAQEKDNGI